MSDELLFVDEGSEEPSIHRDSYKVLVVDDEVDVHKVTRLALKGFIFEDYSIELLHAYSAGEAETILGEHPDVALILLDVVMESETAGLLLIEVIRNKLDLKNVRIVLRTGQPGQAPEQEVIVKYDINDYKSKTELTSQKLHTLLYSSLRSYRDIVALEKSKAGLRQVIEASKGVFDKRSFDAFIAGALHQLIYLLHLDEAFVLTHDCGVFKFDDEEDDTYEVYDHLGERKKIKVSSLNIETRDIIRESIREQRNIYTDKHIALYCHTKFFTTMFFITPRNELPDLDQELINIFSENITIGLENIYLGEEMRTNQKELVYRLGEVVETRSKEAGFHVKRVALYSELLARLAGLSEEEADLIKHAAPLHDIGKIAIPDSILLKAGKLDAEEWDVMKSHAQKGGELLEGSDLYILKAGSIVASTHHEKWDGSGYPKGDKGEDIHIYGRIVALVDVFDALSNKRCYKPAWSMDETLAYIVDQKGKHFDPNLVDLLVGNLELFVEISEQYKDK